MRFHSPPNPPGRNTEMENSSSMSSIPSTMEEKFNWSLNMSLPIPDNYDLSGERLMGPIMETILISLYATICCLGILSNTALIWVVLGKKIHRTPKNLYIVNLAISGISMCVICIPPTLIQCLYGGKWFLGLAACKLVPAFQGTNIFVSTGTITAIAVDRWFSITRSSPSNQVTHCTVILINCSIWVISFGLTLPILIYQELRHIDWAGYYLCVEDWPHTLMKPAVTVAILFIQYIFPMLVLPVVHGLILRFLEENSSLALDARRKERERKRNKRMTFVLSCIALTFAVSWLPLHLFFTVLDLGLGHIGDTQVYFFVLGMCHLSAMSCTVSNPVLYGWLNTNLRKEFIKVLPNWCTAFANRHPRSTSQDNLNETTRIVVRAEEHHECMSMVDLKL
ncbi:neuropeptide F receptor [Eurytemora carolleeae]|uniref:neuropeptide F receptor n=1 Tax=Eurytemora carolleeae TaxID=1294199 RepID=UPI000C78738C|nr:neuropeptide F receptor [Eurytemora carolleeae]|eukprot:XP_023345068.1 neuropeptide F receptor-like [Eurytemora affinis]